MPSKTACPAWQGAGSGVCEGQGRTLPRQMQAPMNCTIWGLRQLRSMASSRMARAAPSLVVSGALPPTTFIATGSTPAQHGPARAEQSKPSGADGLGADPIACIAARSRQQGPTDAQRSAAQHDTVMLVGGCCPPPPCCS